jgi:predicted dehydrogenase
MAISRRRFMQAAALSAAPLILPSAVFGRKRVQPSDKIGIGFVGMGVMNRYHLTEFLKNEAVRVIGVCDVDTTRRKDAKRRVDEAYGESHGAGGEAGGCEEFEDHRDMLGRSGIDAVCIATPDHWHAACVLDAAAAGKDIYCEKPLSLTLREARLMIDAVRKHGRVFQTGSQQRTEYHGYFRTACEYVRSGRIGRLITIHVGVGTSSVPCDLPEEAFEPGLDWDRWLGPAPRRPYSSVLSPRGIHGHFPDWRKYKEYSGGILTDMGAHHFDIAQWGLDADGSGPVEVHPPLIEGASHGARLVYGNGVQVFHGGPSGTTFIGTKGTIYVDRDRVTSTPDSILKEPLNEDDVHLPKAANHRANWLDCIRSREKCICDVEVGARTIAACHLLNLAYWHRRSLKWDPAAWSFANDAKANSWMDYPRREGYELPTV